MMAKRSLETLTDVLVLIVSPILVMIMVGSLAFFLIQCFYDGQFFGRLNFATGLFVMAAVLVARIAIEEGREYASAFALPLGVVTILSMLQYTDLGPFFAIPMVLFIWWSTDKLTWDCTVLDEDKDASGEGLLQTIGLDEGAEEQDGEATTDREQTESQSLWQKWVDRRRRHHTPGVWVMYFGLAAIPLFGIGQSVLPNGSRGAAFLLLCTYVATALSLLMITSFLQMRRYLLQRRLPFTEKMAAIWLGTGGTIIIVLMVLCLLLPRPNTGYSMVDSLSESLQRASSRDDRRASEWSQGREGLQNDERQGRGESEEDANSDSEQGRQTSQEASRGNRRGNGEESREQQENQTETQQGNNGQQPDSAQGDEEGRQPVRSSRTEKPSSDSKDSRDKSQNQADSEAANGRRRDDRNAQENNSDQLDQSDRGGHRPDKPSFEPPSIRNPLENVALPPIPKLVYILFVILGVAALLIFYGRQIFSAIAAFLRDLSALFFGGRKPKEAEVQEAEPEVKKPRPFAAFQDPFATGMAGRLTPQQLVAYTFEALQAWASEQRCPRQEDQTPLEFAGQISRIDRSVGPHAHNLAVLYNQAAYAPRSLGSSAVDHVRALWTALRK